MKQVNGHKGLVTNYGEGGGEIQKEAGGHVKFYPYEKGGRKQLSWRVDYHHHRPECRDRSDLSLSAHQDPFFFKKVCISGCYCCCSEAKKEHTKRMHLFFSAEASSELGDDLSRFAGTIGVVVRSTSRCSIQRDRERVTTPDSLD